MASAEFPPIVLGGNVGPVNKMMAVSAIEPITATTITHSTFPYDKARWVFYAEHLSPETEVCIERDGKRICLPLAEFEAAIRRSQVGA